ncbi:MAG TPA: hypothetical protein VK699_05435 [Terriglobales bacterium]|jgi:hypothetical protein|nr:hypothetical protein [Terriglobales bacterium]
MKRIYRLLVFCAVLSFQGLVAAQTELNKVYADESHCLTGPEIKSDSDNSISCYCRDALVDMRYVYRTYVVTGKDNNLAGVVLALQTHAQQMCGGNYNVWVVSEEQWRWNGPEVVRIYPSDEEIEKLKPNAKGFRTVRYRVQLLHRDTKGEVIRVDNFVSWYLDGPRNTRLHQ